VTTHATTHTGAEPAGPDRRRIAARVVAWVRSRTVSTAVWLGEPQRFLTIAWLVGVIIVGASRAASADIIVGPDLTDGAPKTLYESYDFADYKLTVKPDAENSDWFGFSQTVLEFVGFINNLILWAFLGVLYGALALLEWFLNLTLYRDAAPQIDTATQMIANHVFWPLIAATVAVGAFIAYARWRGEGRGFLSDFGWVVAAGTLAVGFAAGPSSIMNDVDSLRQDLATGVMAGASEFSHTTVNPTGFPTPAIGGDRQTATTRRLVDTLWNTYAATPWCYANFRSLEVCKVVGYHALAGDDQWKQWMAVLDVGGAPPEFGEQVHWIRGQDITRTAYLLVLALITIPMSFMLLRLVVAGLIATVGFLLMLVIGLVFLVFWPIPGRPREIGTLYVIRVIGMEIQIVFITVTMSGVVVVSTVTTTLVDKYGFFVVAMLNLALLAAASRARTWLETITTVGGSSQMGFAAALVMRSVMRTVAAGTRGGVGLLTAGARAARQPPTRPLTGPGWRNRGNWRDSRWNPNKEPSKTHAASSATNTANSPASVKATARRRPSDAGARPTLPPSTPEPTTVAVPDHRRDLGHRQQPRTTPDKPVVSDPKLERNIAATQAATNAKRRVWVSRFGEGLAPVEPSSPASDSPTPATRRRGIHRFGGVDKLRKAPRRRT
jgi:hypothetical protein